MASGVNLASLELHPFLHRAGHLDPPDTMVFDLDPGEGTSLVNCAEVALSLKALLEANGLHSFAKVSRSKGLQVYVPLNTRITYERTRSFARAVAVALEGQHPKQVVSEMAKIFVMERFSSTGAKTRISKPRSVFIPCGRTVISPSYRCR